MPSDDGMQLITMLAHEVETLTPNRSVILETLCRILEQQVNSNTISFNWHPFGFCKIGLGDFENASVRLHIWVPNERKQQSEELNVHKHPWDLKSYIIFGEIQQNLYDVSLEQTQPTHRLYEVTYSGGNSIITATDELVICQHKITEKILIDHIYQMNTTEFHTTFVPDDQFSATLAVTRKREGMRPKVVGNLNGASKYEYDRNVSTHDKSSEIVSMFINMLNG